MQIIPEINKLLNLLEKPKTFRTIIITFFFLSIILRCYHINYPILDRHSWNQVSCAANAMNIYKNPSSFWYPDINAFLGETDSSVLGQEFPVFMGLIAIGYALLGPEIWVARLIAIAIAMLGWIYLFRLCRRTENRVVTLFIMFIFSFNPMNLFFDRAIHSDTGMVSFMIMGLYYFFEFIEKPKWSSFWGMTIGTVLAGLFKPFGLMIGVAYLYIIIKRKKWKILLHPGIIFMGLISWAAVISWLGYTRLNLDNSLGITALEIGNSGPGADLGFRIGHLFTLDFYDTMQKRHFDQMLTPFLTLFFLYGLLSRKIKSEVASALLIGNIFYIVLITHGNYVHNYYQLSMTPVVSIFAGLGLYHFIYNDNKYINKKNRNRIAVFCIILFIPYSFKYAWNHYRFSIGPKLVGDYVRSMKLPSDTRVIALESSSTRFHEILYYADLKGWVKRSISQKEISTLKKRRAQYILYHLSKKQFLDKNYMKPFHNGSLKKVWTSDKCKDNYQAPCFVGVYRIINGGIDL